MRASDLAWLYSQRQKGMKFGLGRMKAAIKRRGSPHRDLRFVHVAGTNGKGSTCAMVERSLRAAGYRTGWFSSPHLHRFGERFRIDGRAMGDAELARRLSELKDAQLDLTFFEYSVLIAFEAFRDRDCDVVVLEVGLGGRLDATNVIERSEVAVVTEIGLDHTSILGSTRTAIAKEKGGILRRGAHAVIGASGDAKGVLKRMCRRRDMPTLVVGEDVRARADGRRAHFETPDGSYRARLALRGAHQVHNASIAVATLAQLRKRGFAVPKAAVVKGLESAKWPGRLEHRRIDGIEWIFDGAHNPSGSAALAAHLATLPEKHSVLLFGALRDKDHEGLLAPLDEHVQARVYALPPVARAGDLRELSAVRRGRVARNVREGLRFAKERAGDGGRVIVAGSLFLVAAARAELLGLAADPW